MLTTIAPVGLLGLSQHLQADDAPCRGDSDTTIIGLVQQE